MSTTEAQTSSGFRIETSTLQDLMRGVIAVNGDQVSLLDQDGNAIKTLSIKESRNWILTRYNWTGMVKLSQVISAQTELISYSSPLHLMGTTADDLILLPGEVIAYLIYLQYEFALCNGKNLESYADGKPGNGTLKDLFGHQGGRIKFMDQGARVQEEILDLEIDIFNQTVLKQQSEAVYQEVRRLVLLRNGLFSDEDRITNVVGFRNWKDSNFSNSRGQRIRMNDHFMVLYRSGGKKQVFLAKGTTDPGQTKTDGHLLSDQTITLTPGWHQCFQAAGRTGNVLRQQNESGSITFVADTGMNFHKANSNHRLRAYSHYSLMKTDSKAQVHTNVLGSDQEKTIYGFIARLQRKLIGLGRKWGDLTVEQQDQVMEILEGFKASLSGYDFYQGFTVSGRSVGIDQYYEMVEGWIQSSDWSYDPHSGHVTQAFSDGCQVFENTGAYSCFMWEWQQFAFSTDQALQSSQTRWYYNLLDVSTLNLPSDTPTVQ